MKGLSAKHIADEQSTSGSEVERGLTQSIKSQSLLEEHIEDDDVMYINRLHLPQLREFVDGWLSKQNPSKGELGAVRLFGSRFAACAVEEGLLEAIESAGEVCNITKLLWDRVSSDSNAVVARRYLIAPSCHALLVRESDGSHCIRSFGSSTWLRLWQLGDGSGGCSRCKELN